MDIPSTDASVMVIVKNVMLGALGSFLNLNMMDGKTLRQRWLIGIQGTILAALCGDYIATLANVNEPSGKAVIVVVTAIFGMAVVGQIMKIINNVEWFEILKGVIPWKK